MNYRRIRVTASSILLLFFPLALLCACAAKDDQEGAHSFRVFEENGITVAETLGGPKYEGELFEYLPVLMLEPGDTEETMLFDPGQFIGDSDGWFYVSDTGNGDIVVFDPEGKFYKRFGRRGAGPGEFEYPSLLFTEDDTVLLFDMMQMRTSRFRRNGELLDMISIHRGETMIVGATTLIPLPGNEQLYLSYGSGSDMDRTENWCSATRLDAEGDTLWTWKSDPVSNSYQMSITLGGQSLSTFARYPYSITPRAYYEPAIGIVAMTSNVPQLEIIDLDGRRRRCIRIDMGDQTVTEDDRQAVRDRYEQRIQEAEDNQLVEMLESQQKALKFGETKAPWTSLKFDDNGYLYLRPRETYGVSPDPLEGINYIVLSPAGEYLGISRRPGGRSTEVMGGRLLVNYSDADTGEFTLTVYEIRPIVEGLEFP